MQPPGIMARNATNPAPPERIGLKNSLNMIGPPTRRTRTWLIIQNCRHMIGQVQALSTMYTAISSGPDVGHHLDAVAVGRHQVDLLRSTRSGLLIISRLTGVGRAELFEQVGCPVR